MANKPRPIDLPQLPQYASIVLLLHGSEPLQLDKDIVAAAAGRPPSNHFTDPTAGTGWIWKNERLVALSRVQGPDRTRLEVKQELPPEIDFSRIQSVTLELLHAAAGRPTHSVGINYGVAVLDYTGGGATALAGLVDRGATKAWLGATASAATEVKLVFPFSRNKLRGERNVQFRLGQMAGVTASIVVDVNYSIETPTRPDALRALSNEMIDQVTTDLRRLAGRISRVAA